MESLPRRRPLAGQDMDKHTLKALRRELEAWEAHVCELALEDRIRFTEWLSRVMTAREFAFLVDSEVDRRRLWKIYLRERYGA